ncbi:hypothetical protein ESCO106035_02465 [Escherichia coli]
MTPSELSDLLWAQVDRVAPHLLPNGKKEGHEWVAGNVNGDKGNSLKVNLSGKKKWADFAEGDGGDMLDLWMACRGINLHQAMQEAKAFLGIKDDDHHFDARREKKFSRPDRKKIARYVTRTESHLEYLQSRGISPEIVKRYEVVSGKVWNGERELDALVIPYKRDGELLQVKRISTERPDGKKVIMAEGDCEPCLFGWQALDAGVRAVVLCEGEIDCMSYAQYGISALAMLYAFKLGRKLRGEEPYCPEKGGKGGSSDKSAKYAAEAQKYAADLQNQQFNTIMNNLKPFTPLADKYVGSLENLSSLEGQGQALNQYYNSQQYKDLAGQARYQSLAAAEATGGLGSTATGNQLATIAPTLGQQWLSGQMNNYQNLANIGLGALQGQANAGQTYANNMSQISQQSAALAAANANRPSAMQSAIGGGASGAIAGAGLAKLIGSSTPWGAGIGAGIGLLGSLLY